MAIQIHSHRPDPAAAPTSRLPEQALAGKQASGAHHASAQAQQKANFNSAVVQSSLAVAIKSGDGPQALLLRSVIESLNEELEATLGPNAIENALGQDNSPEATAERIVSLSTGFFEAFKQNHPGEDEASVLQQFMDTIRSGFERGFAEARDILDGLGALSDEIAEGINRTRELVLQGYADFEASFGQDQSSVEI